MKKYNNQNGFTLIEVCISITLISLIMAVFVSYFLFCVKNCTREIGILNTKENLRYALNYIEKSMKTCNQQKLTYNDLLQRFEGEDIEGHKVFIDLSGKRQHEKHTLIYFYRTEEQLRTNKNGEHNILIEEIKDIIVTEINKNKLIEIKIIGSLGESVKATFKIND